MLSRTFGIKLLIDNYSGLIKYALGIEAEILFSDFSSLKRL